MAVRVLLDEDFLHQLLMNRLDFWNPSETVKELYSKMYNYFIEHNLFEDSEIDVNNIVDNDYANNCSIYHKDNLTKNDYDKLLKCYNNNDFYIEDFEFDFGKPYFLAAVSQDKKSFLIRW